MYSIWPYLLRLAVALYFIYPNTVDLVKGAKKLQISVFSCLNEYIPTTIAFTMWHGFFVVLGILILLWPRPIFPLVMALLILSSELYINFSLQSYSPITMLLFILVLVTLALIIYHSRPQFR
jgi:hypothetical protein